MIESRSFSSVAEYQDFLLSQYGGARFEKKRTAEEVIACLAGEFELKQVTMDQLDAQTKHMLYHSNGRLRSLGYPEIDLEKRGYFAVGDHQASRRYYAYLRSRFGPTAGLYFFQDGEMLTSNCDLLDLKLSILMGIDDADIDGKTQAFFDYLTLIYMFDQASQSRS